MLSNSDSQASFFDTSFICEGLIPTESFYRKFREIVWPLIDDEMFASMYCLDNGRPPISPALLAMATILQFHKNLSDREMERACMFDIEVKYALGLKLDERPFDHSSLGDFRKRLLESGKQKEVFDRILQELVDQELVGKTEIQRIDATHVIADVAIPTMVTMVKKGVREVIKPLHKRHKETHKAISKLIDLSQYDRKTVNHDADGRLDMEKRQSLLVDVVHDAKTVLRQVENIEGDEILSRRVGLLKRILQEHITEEDGRPKEKNKKDKPPDLLVSPVDPDARYGAKSVNKKFQGYKANVTETVESRFITNITAMPGNKPDGRTMVQTVVEQEGHGLIPEKVVGDTAYGDGSYRKDLEKHGTKVVAPQRLRNTKTRAVFPKSTFQYDEENQRLTCPAGETTSTYYWDRTKEIRMFHFHLSKCSRCKLLRQCTRAKEKRRTVGIHAQHWQLIEAEQYNRTEQFKEDMKLRPPIEGKLSELVRYHGMRRARYRGINKLGLQLYFTAAAVNLKRWIKLEMNKMKPKPPELAIA
ncbi:MAG: IS1182 family transposase [Phycisphaerae bacterium]|nr:IS1182 family transposase [Phycisphaerae bacterium]NIR51497.1 IS1182 family transposase [candidate division KSB1 bacterium]NIS26899.1 IS1182 family transposase [candidate division KSB1 bacterium]NIU27630.1 IS1182 family transposase [candidate division KSB1 bacterium]NIV01973.1 IS1182 family transposase [Phycisphaerae bacterium]